MNIEEQIRSKATQYATKYATQRGDRLTAADALLNEGEGKDLSSLSAVEANPGDMDILRAYSIAQAARFMAAAILIAEAEAEAEEETDA